MCDHCNPTSDECEIFIESLTGEWYLYVNTGEWDAYNLDWVHTKLYGIKYCPYCGSELND